jgi:hypothetical protein
MPITLSNGSFYRFDRAKKGDEIGSSVSRNNALALLRRKKDIYTPRQSDAKALAKDVQKGKADWDGAHKTGYFAHFHPAGNHKEYGHIYYGPPGLRQGEKRA